MQGQPTPEIEGPSLNPQRGLDEPSILDGFFEGWGLAL